MASYIEVMHILDNTKLQEALNWLPLQRALLMSSYDEVIVLWPV